MFVHRSQRNAVFEKEHRFMLKGRDVGLDTSTSFYVREKLCPELKNKKIKGVLKWRSESKS